MRSLLLKDIYVLFKQLSMFLIITPLFMLTGELVAIFFILMLFSALPMSAMSYDEHSKWTSYATMLPYSRGELVTSKYLLGYIFIIISICVSLILGNLLSLVELGGLNPQLNFNALIVCVSGALVFIAINMFVNFKFGVEKGRIIYILGFACVGALNGFVNSIDANNLAKFLETPPIVFLLFAIMLNIISIFLSIKFKSKN